jgi:hypothetical protein
MIESFDGMASGYHQLGQLTVAPTGIATVAQIRVGLGGRHPICHPALHSLSLPLSHVHFAVR